MDTTATRPLHGIRVLDPLRLMARTMLTVQLADFGAAVIKIDGSQDDTWRDRKNGERTLWRAVDGRVKESVCPDLSRQ